MEEWILYVATTFAAWVFWVVGWRVVKEHHTDASDALIGYLAVTLGAIALGLALVWR